jgi:hypothetical protein
MALIDDPKFWLGFLGLEVGVPLLIPNKRWAGGLMVIVGVALIGSAIFGDAIGATSLYIKPHLSLLAISGIGVLIIGGIAGINRVLTYRPRADTVRGIASPNPLPWEPLNQAHIANLRNRLGAMPITVERKTNRTISIVREEIPDCARLADDIAQSFRDAGWNIVDGAPASALFWGRVPDGIWVAGPATDPRRAPLLTALREALGSDYEPIRLDTKLSSIPELDGTVAIRIGIGRKPKPQ